MEALKARKTSLSFEGRVIIKGSQIFRAYSAKRIFEWFPPGPVAQAFTFRALGAEAGVHGSV